MQAKQRRLALDDLRRIHYLTDPQLSPDGADAAFTVRVADGAGYRAQVYQLALPDGEPTAVGGGESLPRYSPDGGTLAFLSSRSGEPQVWLQDRATGSQRQLTHLRHGIRSYAWSPDGKRIAFEASLWPGEDAAAFSPMAPMEKAAWRKERAAAPIVVEELMYKFDETYGVVDGSRSRIGVIDTACGSAKLVSPAFDCRFPAWSADSEQLAFYGYPHTGRKARQAELFLCHLGTSHTEQRTEGLRTAAATAAIFTPDGHLLYPADVREENGEPIQKLFHIPAEGGEGICLFPAGELCHGVGDFATGRNALPDESPLFQLGREGEDVFFLSGWQGCTGVYRLPLSGKKEIEALVRGNFSVRSFHAPVNGRLLYIRGDAAVIGELYLLDAASGTETCLTRFNSWLDAVELSQPEELWVDSADGTAKIQGWLLPPVGQKANARCPAVLEIHGGPQVYFAREFWFEFQYLAARGFAVVYCNPRGSAGYGTDFQLAEHGWGAASLSDLTTFLDAAVAKGYIDEDRLGVTGGSYGGNMTLRLITGSDRFKAAAAQRALSNLATSYGTGDMGFVGDDKDFTTMLRTLTDRARGRTSLINRVDSIKTPLLILHATRDYRCSFVEAEQLFIAMKDRCPDIPVRMVAFPGENHNMTRSGRIDAQQIHLEEMAAWFETYLMPEKGAGDNG